MAPYVHYLVTQACARVAWAIINSQSVKGETMDGKVSHPNSATCGSSPQHAAKKRYVQHFSGQGRKWEVVEGINSDSAPFWYVHAERDGYIPLPKSEYVLCKPVKVWRNVTAECFTTLGNLMWEPLTGGMVPLLYQGRLVDGYRLRRVVLQDYAALIVEHEEEEA